MKLQAFMLGLVAMSGTAMAGDILGSGIVVLNPHAAGALEMTGNSSVRIDARAVYVNSDSASAIVTTGTAELDAPAVYIVGNATFGPNCTVTGQVTCTSLPYENPLAGVHFPSTDPMTPKPAVTLNGGNATLTPGYYANGISIKGNSNVMFAPGVFFVRGGLKITGGNIMGAGVCIIMMGGALEVSGSSDFYLAPPTSGDWTGMVLAQPASNTTEMRISGNAALAIHGAIYTPGARVWLTGTSSAGQGPHMGDLIIADLVKLSGTADILVGGADMRAVAPPRPPLYD